MISNGDLLLPQPIHNEGGCAALPRRASRASSRRGLERLLLRPRVPDFLPDLGALDLSPRELGLGALVVVEPKLGPQTKTRR